MTSFLLLEHLSRYWSYYNSYHGSCKGKGKEWSLMFSLRLLELVWNILISSSDKSPIFSEKVVFPLDTAGTYQEGGRGPKERRGLASTCSNILQNLHFLVSSAATAASAPAEALILILFRISDLKSNQSINQTLPLLEKKHSWVISSPLNIYCSASSWFILYPNQSDVFLCFWFSM